MFSRPRRSWFGLPWFGGFGTLLSALGCAGSEGGASLENPADPGGAPSAPAETASNSSSRVTTDAVGLEPSGASPSNGASEGNSPANDEAPNDPDLPLEGPAPQSREEPASETSAPEAEATPRPPAELPPLRVWIAGDSTVANGSTPCPRGWGGAIGARFDERVSVNNAAAGGRSVHTWLYQVGQEMDASGECVLARDASGAPLLQPRWQTMLDGMQPGDYLLIQFGINDGSPTCDRHVGLDAFEAAYGMMAQAARERGAQPVFLTPVSMIACSGSTARGSRGEFVPRTLQAGVRFGVPVIDLHARSVELYAARGFCPVAGGDVSAETSGPVGEFFCDDHTHFSGSGAVEIAELVAQALREQGIPLAAYLK